LLSLALHIVFSSGFGLGVKGSHNRRLDLVTTGSLSYCCSACLAVVWLLARPDAPVLLPGLVYGGINGIAYFSAYFFLIYAMRHQGIAATSAVSQLSILLPIGFSILLWGEYPTRQQSAGILVALSSLLLLDVRRDGVAGVIKSLRLALAAFFLIAGTARLMAKAYAEVGPPAGIPSYVATLFVVTALASVAVLAGRHVRPRLEEVLWGLGIGACNVLQILFFLRALEELPGIIVFPVAGSVSLVVVTVTAVLLFHERPTARLYVGIATSAVAVFLLNWRRPLSP
jgi:drug/metabolite transporter (DMT)-like permease